MKHSLRLNQLRKLRPPPLSQCIAEPAAGLASEAVFAVKGHGISSGWYMIELTVRSRKPTGKAVFSFDLENGQLINVELYFRNQRRSKRLVEFKSRPLSIRLELAPDSQAVPEILHFVSVPAWFARDRMLLRLSSRVERYRCVSSGEIWREFKHAARTRQTSACELLETRYSYTFYSADHGEKSHYANWIKAVETPRLLDVLIDQQQHSEQSIISLIFRVPEEADCSRWFNDSLAALLKQEASSWQALLVCSHQVPAETLCIARQYCDQDQRFVMVENSTADSAADLLQQAISRAQGDWITFLPADALLPDYALTVIGAATLTHSQAEVIYTDEDCIDGQGGRSNPVFKPDWNADFFLSRNYLGHVTLLRAERIRAVGGMRTDVAGGEMYDLLLRCIDDLSDNSAVVHIPQVLCHRRRIGPSPEPLVERKQSSGYLQVLKEYLSTKSDEAVDIEPGLLPQSFHIQYRLPRKQPLVSLLIPTRDQVDLLKACVDSILQRTAYEPYEIIIIDNGSKAESTLAYFEQVQREPVDVKIVSWSHPFNYSAINNFGAEQSRGEILGLINNDVEVISECWLSEMVRHAIRADIGCVGAKLLYSDDTIQHAGVVLGLGGVAGHGHRYFAATSPGYQGRLKLVQNYSAVTAACLLVQKSVFDEVGGLDEKNLKVAFNDVDFCLKVRNAGYRNLWTPYAELYHHESKSRGKDNTLEKKALFNAEYQFMKTKWGGQLLSDPMYSPNLTRNYEDFSLNMTG